MSEWGYSVTSVPSVDDQLNACKALAVGDERTQCWADLDRYLMEDVVPWVPKTFINQIDILSARVTSYSFDEFGGLAALDRLAVEQPRGLPDPWPSRRSSTCCAPAAGSPGG